jgi:hypothetical protein
MSVEANADDDDWISKPLKRTLVDDPEALLDEQLITVANVAASMIEDYPAEFRDDLAYFFYQELRSFLMSGETYENG